jgi:glycerol-3-phosphate O-acyltransferase / dihydroxyacetone phosphate acyltransferase
MGSRLLYDALVRFLWLVTRTFFRTVEVSGREHVPKKGALIFAGNHPNSLIDPMVLTTSCGRRVRFAAKDTLFESRLFRPILKTLGAVPIKRKQDHKDDEGPLDNSAAFDALFDVLRKGGAFGIFPEGISHSRSDLAPLKSGCARIALGAAAEGLPVRLVPSGLSYHKRERFRGRVLLQLGRPIDIDEARVEAFRADPHAAAKALTQDIELSLRALTINAPDFETLRMLDGVRRLYRPPGRRLTLTEEAEITRRFLDHYERLKDIPIIAALHKDVGTWLFSLEALGLSDQDLKQPLSRWVWTKKLLGHLFLMGVLLPLALPGSLVHLPVIALAVVAGDGLTARKDVVATTKMATVTALTLLSYLLVGLWVLLTVRLPLALWVGPCVFVGLLLSGWATIRVLERQAVLRRSFFVLATLCSLRRKIARLRQERDELRQRLLAIVDAHLDAGTERVVPKEEHRAPLEEA